LSGKERGGKSESEKNGAVFVHGRLLNVRN
jgi:hypothetical protein